MRSGHRISIPSFISIISFVRKNNFWCIDRQLIIAQNPWFFNSDFHKPEKKNPFHPGDGLLANNHPSGIIRTGEKFLWDQPLFLRA